MDVDQKVLKKSTHTMLTYLGSRGFRSLGIDDLNYNSCVSCPFRG